MGLFGLVAVSVWALDQVTKVAAVAWLDPGESVVLVPNVLWLTLTRNAGAAFSTGTGFTLLLSLVALVVCVVVVRLASKLRDRVWALGLGLLLGGALGNLTDRILREPGPLRGHVVDFLHLTHWPVFNVADIALTFAAITIILRTWRGVALDGSR
ncbi:signal peptidase II [Aeromicrobium sp.]|uniref:signal peptidase II n=1 Tax=Aeromicrobium sp. TaxID=1871063 RepID=UPI003D6AA53C